MKKYVSCLCHRYEDEINKRNNLENDFVILKKVSISHTHTHSNITGVVSKMIRSIVLFLCPHCLPSLHSQHASCFCWFSVHQFSPPSVQKA